ncbi:hypothetical protein [Streptosporangium sp. NBC_01756]|uniref:hypothetical protein n=1 Tax=Streptosporangium sp. NBC_01756 TaxID=2975950 RepID=UPI002DDC7556|nr:hypothetical protein [Streptosporangium sp. NBC_01756]WSC90246.1 hypothetical protein OIE48_19320 [Streptosporangium sp. NBC_01756]
MRRSSRSPLRRLADVAVSFAVGLYLIALMMDNPVPRPDPLVILGMLAGGAQGAVLWWRRSHPVTVMVIALAGGLVVHILAPQGIFPFAGLVAIGSLAAVRPLRVSLPAPALVCRCGWCDEHPRGPGRRPGAGPQRLPDDPGGQSGS